MHETQEQLEPSVSENPTIWSREKNSLVPIFMPTHGKCPWRQNETAAGASGYTLHIKDCCIESQLERSYTQGQKFASVQLLIKLFLW